MKQKGGFIPLRLLPGLMKFPPQTEVKVILSLSGITPASPSQLCCVIYSLGFTICSRMQPSLAVFWKGFTCVSIVVLAGGGIRVRAFASEEGPGAKEGLPVLCSVSTLEVSSLEPSTVTSPTYDLNINRTGGSRRKSRFGLQLTFQCSRRL